MAVAILGAPRWRLRGRGRAFPPGDGRRGAAQAPEGGRWREGAHSRGGRSSLAWRSARLWEDGPGPGRGTGRELSGRVRRRLGAPTSSAPAHSRFCRGGNLPGREGDSATAAFGPAPPGHLRRAPDVSQAGAGDCGEASGALCTCAGGGGGEEGRRGDGASSWALTTRCMDIFSLKVL